MKRTTILFVLLGSSLVVRAQEAADSIVLDAVTIEAPKVTNTPDGQRYYPTAAQKEHSATAYHLLQQLTLPALSVDPIRHTVTPPPMQGEVQIRINGVLASRDDLLALNPDDIERVDYTDRPGIRYGDGVGYVVDLHVRRPLQGYELGVQAGLSSRRWFTDGEVFGRWNCGLSEWHLTLSSAFQKHDDGLCSESSLYRFQDGTALSVLREDVQGSRHQRSHEPQTSLRYSFVRPEHIVVQAAVSLQSSHLHRRNAETVNADVAENSIDDCSRQPALDLYAWLCISPRTTLVTNIIGITMCSRYNYDYQSVAPFSYSVDGQTHSLQGETLLEHKLKPFMLTVGLNFLQKYTENNYTGDALSIDAIRQSHQRLFVQLSGTLGKLGYKAGAKLQRLCYHQHYERQVDVSLAPYLTLQLPLWSWRLTYDGRMQEKAPRMEYRSSVAVRDNDWDVTAGNPQLHSEQWWEHTFSASLQTPCLYSQTSASFRDIIHPQMTHIKEQDGRFVTQRQNQRRIRILWAQQYVQWQTVPDRLQFTATLGLYRFLNQGYDYFHALTFGSVSVGATAFLGRWTLMAHYDNGWHFVENEREGNSAGAFYVGGACQLGDVSLGLYWQNPLRRSIHAAESTLLNRNVWQHTAFSTHSTANLLNFTITWRLNRGRRMQSTQRQLQLNDNDSGVVRSK